MDKLIPDQFQSPLIGLQCHCTSISYFSQRRIAIESHGVPPCGCTIVLCRESEIEVGPPARCLYRLF